MLSHLYIVTLFAIGVLSQHDCDYGTFEEVNGECKFDCEYDSRYLDVDVESGELSFELIKNTCTNVQRAADAYPSACSSVDDLVWPTDYCGCPACTCDPTVTHDSPINVIKYFSKECLECSCIESTTYGGQSVYDCDELGKVYGYELTTWESWQCPPITCDGRIAGNFWFEASDNLQCDKVCICTDEGEPSCRTAGEEDSEGWEYIFEDAEFENYIQDECGWNLIDCLYEPERMFADDSSYCGYSCPKCDCGVNELDDTWYTDFKNPWLGNREICVECKCVADDDDSKPYAECFDDSTNYYAAGDECIDGDNKQTKEITCYSDSIYDGDSGELGSGEVETCTFVYYGAQETTDTIAYCSNSNYLWSDGKYNDYHWGCESHIFPMCEAYGTDDGCISYTLEFKEDFCDSTQEAEIFKGYEYCCSTDTDAGCNYKAIDYDEITCPVSEAYQNVEAEFQTCLYPESDDEDYELLKQYFCDLPVDDEDLDGTTGDLSCEKIEKLEKHILGCYCDAYKTVYQQLSETSPTRVKLQQSVDQLLSTASRYNQYPNAETEADDGHPLGCEISFECDLSAAEGIKKSAAEKCGMFGVFVAVFCALIMYYA